MLELNSADKQGIEKYIEFTNIGDDAQKRYELLHAVQAGYNPRRELEAYAIAHRQVSNTIPVININDPHHQHLLRLELEARRDPTGFKQFDAKTQEQLAVRYTDHVANIAAQKSGGKYLLDVVGIGVAACVPFLRSNAIKSTVSVSAAILRGSARENFEGLSPEQVEYFTKVDPKFFLDPKKTPLNPKAQQMILDKLINHKDYSAADLAKEFEALTKSSAAVSKKEVPAGYAKTQLDGFKEFRAKAKQFANEIEKNKTIKDQKVRLQQFKDSFDHFAGYAMPLANLVAGLGQIQGSPELKKIGVGVGSALQMGEMLTSLAAGLINPAFAVMGVTGCLMNLAGLFGEEEQNPLAEGMQQIISTLHEMWKEIRQEFKQLHEEIQRLAKKIDEGFIHIEKLMRNQHGALIEKLNEISRDQLDAKHVIVASIREHDSRAPDKLITDMALSSSAAKTVENPQKLTNDMFYWIKDRGGLCGGMHTGVHEQKSIHNEKINDLLNDPANIDSYLGLLAEVVRQDLKNDDCKDINPKALINPQIWCQLTDAYIAYRNRFIDEIHDENNSQIDSVMYAGNEALKLFLTIRSKPKLYENVLQGYDNTLKEIQTLWLENLENIAKENEKINNKAKLPGSITDIKLEQKVILEAFKAKVPLTTPISVELFNIKLEAQHSYESVNENSRAALNEKIDPAFIALAHWNLATFRMHYDRFGQPELNFYVYFKLNNKEHKILIADFTTAGAAKISPKRPGENFGEDYYKRRCERSELGAFTCSLALQCP